MFLLHILRPEKMCIPYSSLISETFSSCYAMVVSNKWLYYAQVYVKKLKGQ